MQIQSGKLYENRTWKYLYPCLKYYGTELIDYLGNFFKLAVGIGDSNVTTEGNCIFILIDTNIRLVTEGDVASYKRRFSKFLDWIKYQDYYVTDYVFTGLDRTEKHMVVLKLPEVHNNTYLSFIRGKYSDMYSKEDIDTYFNILPNKVNNPNVTIRNERVKQVKSILKKDKELVPVFVEKVNREFRTTVTVEDFKDAELDFPINLSEEIFNYKG